MMDITREFTKEQFLDLDLETIDTKPWRHGTKRLVLFESDGAHWAAWLDFHHDDGLQLGVGDTIVATKMRRVERMVASWEPV